MATPRLERGAAAAAAPITRARLKRFVQIRRRSSFSTNLQFAIDADAAGFKVELLGDPRKFTCGGFTGYQWDVDTPSGNVTLIEFGGRGRNYYLSGDTDADTVKMFDLMKRAQFETPAVAP